MRMCWQPLLYMYTCCCHTGLWLQVLHVFLELLQVPNRIVVGAFMQSQRKWLTTTNNAGGQLVRGTDPVTGVREGRIQFLAKVPRTTV